MISRYQKRANIFAGVWLVSMLLLGVVAVTSEADNVWSSDSLLPKITVVAYVLSMLLAFWYFAKAKGYSGIVGILLSPISIFGLFALLSLPDRSGQ